MTQLGLVITFSTDVVIIIIIIIIMYANLYSAITVQKITRALYMKIVTGYKL